jgi:hypothetical protein
MKRRLNYTDRKRILRDRINIMLQREDGLATSFSAKIDVSDLSLPADAKLYVEAYHRTELRRYDFGTVGKTETPRDSSLANLARGQNLRFRVLVVDQKGARGLILAHADRISPVPEGERKSILPVYFDDIGQQTWKVRYTEYEGGPALILNSRMPNIRAMAKSDPGFFFFVYPAVIREILTHMIFVEGVDSTDEPSIDWHSDWLQFATRILSGERSPSVLDPRERDDFDAEEVQTWVNRVVEEFCSSRKEWPRFLEELTGGEAP